MKRDLKFFITSLILHLIIIFALFFTLKDKSNKNIKIAKKDKIELNLDYIDIKSLNKKAKIISRKKSNTPLKKKRKIPPQKRKKVIKKNIKKTSKNIKKIKKKSIKRKKILKKVTKTTRSKIKNKKIKKAKNSIKKVSYHKKIKKNQVKNIQNYQSQKRYKKSYSKRINIPPPNPTIARLYGSSYFKMSKAQREFINNNLRMIMIISQNTLNQLGYPPLAGALRHEGVNIISFYLYPNGNISDLKIISSSGYEELDRRSLEVVRNAYFYYPHPKEKTKIIIYVEYRLQ